MKKTFIALAFAPIFLLGFWGCGWEASKEPLTYVIDTPIAEKPDIPKKPEASLIEALDYHYENYLRASCRVSSGGSGICYKIDDRYVYILTCRHVVGSKKNFTVEFWKNGKITGKYPAKVSKVYRVDAAILRASVKNFKEDELPVAIPLSDIAPMKSDPIISIGAPGFGWQTLFEGRIIRFSRDGDIIFTPPPKGGRSGSGIIQNGKLIGILWGASDTYGLAVDCRDLKDLMKPKNLYFMANWCKYCNEMESIVAALGDVEIIDYDLNKSLTETYGITKLPSYVNKQGDVISGLKTTEELREFYNEENTP